MQSEAYRHRPPAAYGGADNPMTNVTQPTGRTPPSARQFAHHALDQPVHVQDLGVAERLAGGHHHLAFVVPHVGLRGKRLQPARGHVGLPRQHLRLHGGGHLAAKPVDADHAVLHAAPHAAALPVAVDHGLGPPRVVVPPEVSKLLKKFDKTYTHMLINLEKAWQIGEQGYLVKGIELMFSMREIARSLMQIPIEEGPCTFGPLFRWEA